MSTSLDRKVAGAIAIAAVGVPLLLMMTGNVPLGAVLLPLGLIIASRAIWFSRHGEPEVINDDQWQRINRHQSEWGRTIYVQLVDDLGCALPTDVAQKRLAEAYAKASPRDTVVGVHYKIPKDEATTSKA